MTAKEQSERFIETAKNLAIDESRMKFIEFFEKILPQNIRKK